jgi:hypothetical protein
MRHKRLFAEWVNQKLGYADMAMKMDHRPGVAWVATLPAEVRAVAGSTRLDVFFSTTTRLERKCNHCEGIDSHPKLHDD